MERKGITDKRGAVSIILMVVGVVGFLLNLSLNISVFDFNESKDYLIQYSMYICYHDTWITFQSFSSSGIMASKKEDSAEQGASRASRFVINFCDHFRMANKDPNRIRNIQADSNINILTPESAGKSF